jgi:hypothetical protein
MRQELKDIRDDNMLMVRILTPMDIKELELLQKVQEIFSEALNEFYKLELNNEETSTYLDQIGSNMSVWDALIDYITYHSQLPLFQKDRPRLPQDGLNYLQVKKKYGAELIEPIMEGLVQNIINKGGEELFYKFSNTYEDAAYWFAECFKQITQQNIDFTFPETEWKSDAQKMLHYYHNANQYISIQWQQIKWKEYNHAETPLLTDRVKDIIRARAYVEFCKQTASVTNSEQFGNSFIYLCRMEKYYIAFLFSSHSLFYYSSCGHGCYLGRIPRTSPSSCSHKR